VNKDVLRLGYERVGSAARNLLYYSSGIDITRPIHLHGQLNYKCNSRCPMCDSWRKGLDGYTELPAAHWIRALADLKSISPNFKASFAGGEILQKKDAWDIFQYCHDNDIIYGIVTSGVLLSRVNARKLVSLRPFNIHVSLDSLDEDNYERIRGIRRLTTVQDNIRGLQEILLQERRKIPVSIKTVVCKSNLHELPALARYTRDSGLQGITFQTVFDYIDEAYNEFITDLVSLETVIDELIAMKSKGYPILNSVDNMKSWVEYYERGRTVSPRTAQKEDNGRCGTSLMNLYILASGEVKLCELYDEHLGRIQDDSLLSIVKSQAAVEKKKELSNCQRNCVYCIKRTPGEYLSIAKNYIGAG